MKVFFLSDIHGSLPRLAAALQQFEALDCDLLALGGDLLNYGPRNGLSEGLDAPAVAERLNALADRIVAVRGNCDAEVDQMLLRFPMMADYAMIAVGKRRVMLTHGHLALPEAARMPAVDMIASGHTHLWALERGADEPVRLNTGSITFPKGGCPPTFATMDDAGRVEVRTLAGETLKNIQL